MRVGNRESPRVRNQRSLPWFCNPRVMRQNAKRARLKRKGLTPKSKAELQAWAATLAPRKP